MNEELAKNNNFFATHKIEYNGYIALKWEEKIFRLFFIQFADKKFFSPKSSSHFFLL